MARKCDDWLETYMTYTENSEPPTLYRKWVGISVIAAALQRKCRLEWGTLTFYPNMYIVLVGPSGRCRKGTAMGVGKKLIDELDIPIAAEAITREALIRELANSEDVVHTNDGKLISHSSLTIYSQELTVFLGYQNSKLLMDLTDWYDCRKKWTYRTKNSGTDDIQGVYVNLIGATTPSLIRSSLPLDAIGGGLASRMIFVYEEQKGKVVPAPFLAEGHEEMWDDLVKDLQEIHRMYGQFHVTDKFLERYIEWYHYQEDNRAITQPEFAGYNERRPNHLFKLCIIFSAARREDMKITEQIFEDALDILESTEKKMPRTFSGYGSSDTSEVLSDIMAYVASHGKVSKSKLMQRFYGQLNDERQLSSIIETLEVMGFAKVNRSRNPLSNGSRKTTLEYQTGHDFTEQYDSPSS